MSFDPQTMENAATDKQSALAAAAVVALNPPIATQNLYAPVSKSSINVEAANKKADGAKGKAVAEVLIKELYKQEIKLVRFLRNIADLGQEGRTQFRVTMKERAQELKNLLDGHDENSYEYKLIKQAHATNTVRMSEIKKFSEACDIGFTFDDSETYPTIISAARLWKQGVAADGERGAIDGVGPTRRRGRPATPFADKFKKFLVDNINSENHKEASDLFATWIALQNFDKTPQG